MRNNRSWEVVYIQVRASHCGVLYLFWSGVRRTRGEPGVIGSRVLDVSSLIYIKLATQPPRWSARLFKEERKNKEKSFRIQSPPVWFAFSCLFSSFHPTSSLLPRATVSPLRVIKRKTPLFPSDRCAPTAARASYQSGSEPAHSDDPAFPSAWINPEVTAVCHNPTRPLLQQQQ